MKPHFVCMAFLITGIFYLGNPLAMEGSGTNRTDSTAGTGLRSDAVTNAPATYKELRTIQMQRERLDALSVELQDLLTRYTEKDKRVRVVRKQIADVQKQLASEHAATLPTGSPGTNHTARASNATTQSTDAPAKGNSASANIAKATTAGANAPTNIGFLTSPATNSCINATAKTTNASAKATAAITNGTVATAKAANVTANDRSLTSAATSGTDATASTNVSVNLVTMETLDDTHRLAIGDKLSFRIEEDKYRPASEDKLSVRGEDEPTSLIVTDSGELEVPYIGLFPAENKTCKQLAYELKTALEKDYFYKATVILAVDLKAKTLGRVYLMGAIHAPGPEEIPSDEVLTLGKAILRAGGFTDFAERHDVKVTRKANGSSKTETLVVDVAQVFDKGKTELDLPLEPGDLILVPERLVRF